MPAVVWATNPPPVQVAQAAAAPGARIGRENPAAGAYHGRRPEGDRRPKPTTWPKAIDGTFTGTVNDIVVSDAKAGLTLAMW